MRGDGEASCGETAGTIHASAAGQANRAPGRGFATGHSAAHVAEEEMPTETLEEGQLGWYTRPSQAQRVTARWCEFLKKSCLRRSFRYLSNTAIRLCRWC